MVGFFFIIRRAHLRVRCSDEVIIFGVIVAIYHLSIKPISRSVGRSAVAAAAYRTATRLTNARDGVTHDFRRRAGVELAEIVLPEGLTTMWAKDRATLWNAAEAVEVRRDARVARELELALPFELPSLLRTELTRGFAIELANHYSVAVDFAIHSAGKEGDSRNHHAHLLLTTRIVSDSGLQDKSLLERENKWLVANGLPTSFDQIRAIRQRWEHHVNAILAGENLAMRIDSRAHVDRALDIEPTRHLGVHATELARRKKYLLRTRLGEETARRNADLIRTRPDQLLAVLIGESGGISGDGIMHIVRRYVGDNPTEISQIVDTVIASSEYKNGHPEISEDADPVAATAPRTLAETQGKAANGANKPSELFTANDIGEREGEARQYLSLHALANELTTEAVPPLPATLTVKALDRLLQAYSLVLAVHDPTFDVRAAEAECVEAGRQLDSLEPKLATTVRSALQYDAGARRALSKGTGLMRVQEMMPFLSREVELNADPNVRAERALERWHKLTRQLMAVEALHIEQRQALQAKMSKLILEIENDRDLSAVLELRRRDTRIADLDPAESVVPAMKKWSSSDDDLKKDLGVEM